MESTSPAPRPLNIDACRVIAALGGTGRVARLCRVKPPSVSQWRYTGIPPARLDFLQLRSPDIFARLAHGGPEAAANDHEATP